MSEATPSKPIPVPDADTAPFWAAASEGALSIQRCSACERLVFPPKPLCPRCMGPLQWTKVSGLGHVYTYCVTHMSLVKGFGPPYVTAVIALREQADCFLNANVIECAPEQVRIGMAVEVVFETRGDIVLPQFRPVRA